MADQVTNGLRVLIVEDDRNIAHGLYQYFRVFLCHPQVAPNLKDARRIMNGHRLVVLDVQLGDGLGTELLAGFDAPIIVMSAHDPRELLERFKLDVNCMPGQSYYAQKPFVLKKLIVDGLNAVRARSLFKSMLVRRPGDGDLDRECANLLGDLENVPMMARDSELLRRWLELPEIGKTGETAAPYLLLLDDLRDYLRSEK